MPKEFLTHQQQMEKLRSSGLAIEDEEACCRILADIGYFPVVNGYQSFFRDPSTRVYRRRMQLESRAQACVAASFRLGVPSGAVRSRGFDAQGHRG